MTDKTKKAMAQFTEQLRAKADARSDPEPDMAEQIRRATDEAFEQGRASKARMAAFLEGPEKLVVVPAPGTVERIILLPEYPAPAETEV